jgi:hypothetical protein
MIEEWDDPAKARSLYGAGRARAADAGNLEIELRALQDLAVLESNLGNLAAARALYDEGVELADRTGLGWSGVGMRGAQCMVCYLIGDWDECERLIAAVPERVMTLAVQHVAAHGLAVQWPVGDRMPPNACRTLLPSPAPASFLMWRSGRPTWPSGRVTSIGRGRLFSAPLPLSTRLNTSTRLTMLPGCV